MLPKNIKTIIDLTIGDGWLGYKHKTDAYPHFDVMHSIKQIDYAKHKQNILDSLGYTTNGYIYTDPRTSFLYYRFYTLPHVDFKTAYKHLYNRGKKTIDKHLLRDLDEESLAFIFMDDGSAHVTNKSKHGNRYQIFSEPITTAYRISLNSFGKDEIFLFQEWLLYKFQIETKLEKQWDSFRVVISKNSSKDKLRSIIKPFIVTSMEYKIKNSHVFNNIPYYVITGSQTERKNSENLDEATVEN